MDAIGIRDLPTPEPAGTNELVQHIGQRHGSQTSQSGTGVDRGWDGIRHVGWLEGPAQSKTRISPGHRARGAQVVNGAELNAWIPG